MNDCTSRVVFFDIGDTLASASLNGTQIMLNPLPGVIDSLIELRDHAFQLGIISNTPDFADRETMRASLEIAGLAEFFAPERSLYSSVTGLAKDSVQVFCFAADLAGFAHKRERCMFVGENAKERQFASEAGFKVAESVKAAHDALLNVT